jgi:hypothetical protein
LHRQPGHRRELLHTPPPLHGEGLKPAGRTVEDRADHRSPPVPTTTLRRFVGLVLALTASATWLTARAADLTSTEQRWLQGAWPVVQHAKQQQLPLDIVVQPQAAPGRAPLALGFVNGRCKLVLSMRGNPEAEATLARIAPDLLDATLELMAAHELGHCRRYLDGAWNGLPAGFTASEPEGLSPERRQAWQDMQSARREEGYGDLVGLAWTQQHHPALYARLHAWLLAERLHERVPGSHHDTVAWVRLAGDGRPLAGTSLFEGADKLWQTGLLADTE